MNTLEATVLVQSSTDLLRMIILIISQSSSNMGDIGSKTRSVCQIIEKPYEHSRGHSFGRKMIILTISQSSSNMGDVGSKTRSVGQIMKKPCEHSRGHSFGLIFIKLAKNDHLDKISVKFKYG